MIAVLTALLGLAGTSDASIRWSPPRAIYVNVVNRDLAPSPGTTVSIEKAGAPGAEPVRRATTNAGGRAEFRDLPPGSYVVRVAAPGHLEMTFGPVPIDAADPPSVRVPEILAVVNPMMEFGPASH